MEELQGLGLGCWCFLLSVFLGPLVDEKGRAQRPGQPLPQASLGPPDKSSWPWNLHNAMQVRLALSASDFSLTAGYRHCLFALHLGNKGVQTGAESKNKDLNAKNVKFCEAFN